MQFMDNEIIEEVKKAKMKKLFLDLSKESVGSMIECPECKYISPKTKRPSAKIFDNSIGRTIKCFNCGLWRKLL